MLYSDAYVLKLKADLDTIVSNYGYNMMKYTQFGLQLKYKKLHAQLLLAQEVLNTWNNIQGATNYYTETTLGYVIKVIACFSKIDLCQNLPKIVECKPATTVLKAVESESGDGTGGNGSLTAKLWYGDTDMFSALSSAPSSLVYQLTTQFAANQPISFILPQAACNNKFLVIQVPIGQSRTTYFNTNFNQGTIPDFLFRQYFEYGSFGYIMTSIEASMDYTKPLIFIN
jgi:hypothetical protein